MTASTDVPDAVAPATLFRHVDHIAQLVGAAHVGFGLDYIPDTSGLLAWIRSRPETFPADQHRTTNALGGPGKVIEPMVALMLRAGYAEADVRNVLGENWLRVFRAAGC